MSQNLRFTNNINKMILYLFFNRIKWYYIIPETTQKRKEKNNI